MKTRKHILVLGSLLAIWCLGLPSLASAATIYGTVTDSNGPVGGINMSLMFIMPNQMSNIYSIWTQTESDGTYFFSIPPGSYLIMIPRDWEDTPYVYQDKRVPVIEDGDSIQNDFQLELAPSIRGSIYQADGETLVDDTYHVLFQESCAMLEDGPEVTVSLGQYSSPVLPSGDYYLALLNEAGEFIGWRTASGIPTTNCADAVSVPVDGNQTVGVNFVLEHQAVLVPIYNLLLRNR